MRTQLLQTPIPVMKNDVLGVYQPPNAKNDLLYSEYGGPDNLVMLMDRMRKIWRLRPHLLTPPLISF